MNGKTLKDLGVLLSLPNAKGKRYMNNITTEPLTKKTAILGFGNPVRADDGVGIYVIEQLKAQLGTLRKYQYYGYGNFGF